MSKSTDAFADALIEAHRKREWQPLTPTQQANHRLDCLRLATERLAAEPSRALDDVLADASAYATFVLGENPAELPRQILVMRDCKQGEVLPLGEYTTCAPHYARWARTVAMAGRRSAAAKMALHLDGLARNVGGGGLAEPGEDLRVEVPAPLRPAGVEGGDDDALEAAVPRGRELELGDEQIVHGSGSSGCGDREDGGTGGRGPSPSADAPGAEG